MSRTRKFVLCLHRLAVLPAWVAILGLCAAYAQNPSPPVILPTGISVPLDPVDVPTHSLSTLPSMASAPRAMKLLVMTVTGTETSYNAITTFLQEIGIPYQAVMVNTLTPDSSGNRLNSLAFTDSSNRGLYEGVILTIGNLGGLLSADDWIKLDNYTSQYSVRTVSYYSYPDPRYGLTPGGSGGYYTQTNPLNVALTSAGSAIFPYIISTATIPVGGPVINGSSGPYVYLAGTTAAQGETTTSLLTANGYTVGAAHTTADGRQSIALTMDNDVGLLHSVAFNYGLINWVTNGIFLGSRQLYLSPQIDDLFIADVLYNCPTGQLCIDRTAGSDLTTFQNWQAAKQAIPVFSGYRSSFPFVGDGTTSPFLPPGYNDTLTPVAKTLAKDFFWISHTYDHSDLDTYTLSQSLAEIDQNLTIASGLGLTVDTASMVTPYLSGLSNASFLTAAVQSGISYLVTDAGYATGAPPSPNVGIVDPTNTSILEIPRRDTNLYVDTDVPTTGVPGSVTDEYNANYASTLGTKTYSQIIASESFNELINILHYEPYPLAFHISNINAYDGTHSMFSDLFDSVFAQYQSIFNLPIKSLTEAQIGGMLISRNAYNNSGIAGIYTPGVSVALTTTNAATIPITGACSQTACPTYGGQIQDAVQMSSGGKVTISLSGGSGVALSSVSLNPTSVTGGSPSTGTVTLTGPAPSTGTTVTLSSNNAAATVSPTVTVTSGNSSATFTVTTTAVTTLTLAAIGASYNGVNESATLTITAPAPALSAVSVNPTAVIGGTSSTGTVTLTAAAPTSGISVTLSSNSAAATVPPTVTVTSGNSSATFTVTTTGVATTTAASIGASYNSVNKSATLTINPPALSAISLNPTSVTGGSPSTGTVTLTGPAPTGGIPVTLSSNNAAATVPPTVTVTSGNSSATFAVTTTGVATTTTASIGASYNGVNESATLTITAPAPALSAVSVNPTTVIGGTSSTGTVTLTAAAPTSGISVTLSSNSASATVPPTVTVTSGNSSATFTVTTTGVATTTAASIGASYNSVNKSATLTINPPALSAISLNPTSVTGGSPSTGTVTLTGPAPTGGIPVTLSSNNASATVPPTVTVTSGNSSATFTVTTTGVATTTAASIGASYNSVNKSATLTINPPALSAISLNPTSVTGGSPSTGTVTLTGPAPTGGIPVTLSSNNVAATVSPTVTVTSGNSSATFTVTTTAVTTLTLAAIGASYNGVNESATLTITAPAPALSAVSVNPTTVIGVATEMSSAPAIIGRIGSRTKFQPIAPRGETVIGGTTRGATPTIRATMTIIAARPARMLFT